MIHPSSSRRRSRRSRLAALAIGAAAVLAPMLAGTPALAAPATAPGDPVYVGPSQGYGGTPLFPIWYGTTAVGEPDAWAYCIENRIHAHTSLEGVIADPGDFLGNNLFTDPATKTKVYWILGHGYPALSLDEFRAVTGVPSLTRNDAIEVVQNAIWRFTDTGYDSAWPWTNPDSVIAYDYLVNGAKNTDGTPDVVTASITAPAEVQYGTLAGPFTVHLSTPTGIVSTDSGFAIVDAAGAAIDQSAVVDGQEVYLDLRGTTAAGAAAVTVSARGASMTGQIVNIPLPGGGPATSDSRSQTVILVAASTLTVSDQASIEWAGAPVVPTEPTAPTEPTTPVTTAPKAPELAATGASVAPAGLAGLAALALLAGAAALTPALRTRRTR